MNKEANQIIEKITHSKVFEERLCVPTPFFIGEIGELGKVLLAQSFRKQKKKNIVFLTEKRNISYYEESALGLGLENCIFLDDDELDSKKIKEIFFSEKDRIVFCPFELALRGVVAKKDFQKRSLRLKIGDKVSLGQIAEDLSKMGFERVKKAFSFGEFAIRGDTIEVGTTDGFFRVDLFGNEIEKIVSFDPIDKEVLEQKESLGIYPIVIEKGDSPFLSYFDGFAFLIDGEDDLRGAVFSFFQVDDGRVSSDEIAKMKEIEEFLRKQDRIYLEGFHVTQEKGVNLEWQKPKQFNGDLKSFVDFLKKSIQDRIYIFTKNFDGLGSFLSEQKVSFSKEGEDSSSGITLIDSRLNQGVDLKGLNLVVFGNQDIFGRVKTKKKKNVDFSALTNLKKGECVVHIDHGIGIFTGFGEMVVDGIKREYIFIEYSGGDKIYVPFDQADKITKYISVGNSAPLLSSLKTTQWIKTRKKVQENVEKIARELIENQALRIGEKPFFYTDDLKEQEALHRTFIHKETPDQGRAIDEVLEDMNQRKPMDRLVCGDVGYGKTEVAIRATARAVLSGGQVAVLAPTTILAEQHLQTFKNRLEQFGFNVASLSRFRSPKEQKAIIEKVTRGEVDVIIGTHRILSSDIKFKNLFLIIVDEEQKFGVVQKEKLKKMRDRSDLLAMTATPIPRTLYMGLSGLKDISVISTPPEGRLPVKTIVVKNDDSVISDAIKKEVERGGQVYFVHNRVETIQALASKLRKMLPKVRMEVAHGKMPEEKLAKIMNDFADGEFQVLICSTIIESGLDISTVNTLIVNKATHFGLSQLHQLRGRIGRSSRQAYAFFLYDTNDLKGNAQRRLKTIAEKGSLGSGYELSLEDLDIRGSGNILGKEQHGSMQMVGVGYYLKLLEEATETIKNGGIRPKRFGDIRIDLPISAFIPDDFYEKEEEKIRAYQKLASVESEDELQEFLSSIKKEIPKEIKNLAYIVGMKLKCHEIGIKSVVIKDVLDISGGYKKRLYIDFDHVLSKEEVRVFVLHGSEWYFGNTQIRIDLKDLGDSWREKLSVIIEGIFRLSP